MYSFVTRDRVEQRGLNFCNNSGFRMKYIAGSPQLPLPNFDQAPTSVSRSWRPCEQFSHSSPKLAAPHPPTTNFPGCCELSTGVRWKMENRKLMNVARLCAETLLKYAGWKVNKSGDEVVFLFQHLPVRKGLVWWTEHDSHSKLCAPELLPVGDDIGCFVRTTLLRFNLTSLQICNLYTFCSKTTGHIIMPYSYVN